MNTSELNWEEASKKIFNENDIKNFKRSIAFHKLHKILNLVTETVKGKDVPSGILNESLISNGSGKSTSIGNMAPPSDKWQGAMDLERKQELLKKYPRNVAGVLQIIQYLDNLIDEVKPFEGPRRFGNLACRIWHEKIEESIDTKLEEVFEAPSAITDFGGFILEIKHYFLNSFGSKIRLDYGTGHELSFLAFIGSLVDFEFIKKEELSGEVILVIFSQYYDLVRRLILVYNLEPAGSHGVWGLDDHFHLIYIIGAAQFNSNPNYPPVRQVLSNQVIYEYQTLNLYINAISFIYKIKSGPFHEHSPIIRDIHTSVSLWSKVLSGLLKMYEVEVLGKFPVVQHFWFTNNLYPWRDYTNNRDLPCNENGESDEVVNEEGFINKNKGVKTTNTNISMTGAPWARNTNVGTRRESTGNPRFLNDRMMNSRN